VVGAVAIGAYVIVDHVANRLVGLVHGFARPAVDLVFRGREIVSTRKLIDRYRNRGEQPGAQV
jgi:hypothetical protein